MIDPQWVRRAGRHFSTTSPQLKVAACQLPLTLLTAALYLAAPAAWPGLLESRLGLAALGLHAVLLLACLVVPWQRFGPHAPLVIPAADLLAIGLSRAAGVDNMPALGILSIFPVVWISASRLTCTASITLSFLVTLVAGLPRAFTPGPAPPPARLADALLLPLMMLAVSVAICFARYALLQQQERIESKEAELQALLAESRDRERLLNTILDTVDVGIVAVDADGNRLLTNSWQSHLEASAAGAGPPDGAGPTDAAEEIVLTGQDRRTPLPEGRHPIRRALNGESFADYLVCFGERPGSRVVSTGGRPLKNDDGDFSGAVVVFSEVTGLVEALAAKDDVVSTVSHEFRTPLTSIIGNLDLVLDDMANLADPALRRVEVAQRNAERLLALVSDLLLSANSAVHVYPRRSDLASLVEASLDSARTHAESSGVSLSMDVPAPLWAHVDPLRISQALDNLVSNAIKYSPGGGAVRISASTEGGSIRLEVADTGMGMTMADAGRVFTRFFRSPAVREGAIPGAGLGLSITKAIVERHGGSITCSSCPGRGSTFTLDLPAGPAPPA